MNKREIDALEFAADTELFFDTLFEQMAAGRISPQEVNQRFFKRNWICGYSDCGLKKETEGGLCGACGRFPTTHAPSRPVSPEDVDAS